jgi:hypothetical protein
MATPVLPPEAVILIDLIGQGRPPGTALKPFYDWLLAVQRALASGGGIGGVTDGTSALPGQVGQIIESNLITTNSVVLTSGVTANVTSIALTPGDWRVFFAGKFNPASGTSIFSALMSLSTASATLQGTPESRQAYLPTPDGGMVGAGGQGIASCNVGPTRISVTANTTLFATAFASFSGGTNRAYGHLWAERRR